jgi:hypothetical protein
MQHAQDSEAGEFATISATAALAIKTMPPLAS